jgi:hypothetical protein
MRFAETWNRLSTGRSMRRPAFAGRVQAARREERFFGMISRRNFFRKPYGPGWALTGDAGYYKDPITAQGMRDAFRDADLLAGALVDGSPGALDEFERRRNQESAPIYEMTLQRASFAPPPPDAIALLTALRGNQEQTDRWAGIDAGSVSPAEFYSPENVATDSGGRQRGGRRLRAPAPTTPLSQGCSRCIQSGYPVWIGIPFPVEWLLNVLAAGATGMRFSYRIGHFRDQSIKSSSQSKSIIGGASSSIPNRDDCSTCSN